MDSLERIETIALADLGMEKPSADDYCCCLWRNKRKYCWPGPVGEDITPAEGLEQISLSHRLALPSFT